MKKLNKRKILQDLANFYQVNLVLKRNYKAHATVDLIYDVIYIDFDESYPLYWLLTNFFHEYAHLYCKYNNIYPLYHSDILFLTKKQRTSFLRTIWRAETFADKLGAQFLKTHFNDRYQFIYGYIEEQKPFILPETVKEMKTFFKCVDIDRKLKRLKSKSQNETTSNKK